MKRPLTVLWEALSVGELARVAADVAIQRLTRPPLSSLPAARDARERATRAQAAPAIALYRALRRVVGQTVALPVCEAVIAAGGIDHLRATLSDLDPDAYARLDADARRYRVHAWIARFTNMRATVAAAEPSEVAFTVTRCDFVRLCRAAGHPELARAFCEADRAFFASLAPAVTLTRATTLADGGASCPFVLRLAEPT